MSHFNKPKYLVPRAKKDIPKGLYTKCPISGEIIFNKELEANLMVVPSSGYHFPIGARERIESLIDPGTWHEIAAEICASDPLGFVDSQPYTERLLRYEKESGLPEAVVTGYGRIRGVPASIAVMDFRFCGGTLGSAAGEKITRAIEYASEKMVPCIIFSTSGGARMQEGILSLMQMAKTSAALGRLAAARLPFISVLTNPTTGGVSASYATLGDVIIAEPGALIGFAGPRVIKETTRQTLPPGFQSAEFLLQHGLIDFIVPRTELREKLHEVLLALYIKKLPAADRN
jgi:acetyl-CoA carboxylase carboxyl transferase subunit beta